MAPAGATHVAGNRYYKATRQGYYRWSDNFGMWRYMEDGKGRRALRNATELKEGNVHR